MKKNIIYIGNFSFPFGNASGKRVYGNGKLLESLGYKVSFIGLDNEIDQTITLKNTEKVFHDFKYYNLPYPANSIEWLKYRKAFNNFKELIANNNKIDDLEAIIIYGSPRLSVFNHLLIKWCNNNNVKIISDCVDWLSADTGRFAFDLIKWADTTYQKAYLNKRVDGVIAISSFLDKYYQKSGVKTCIIPPLSTDKPLKIDKPNNEKLIKLIYAGIPFNKNLTIKDPSTLKDRIDITIKLLSEIPPDTNFIFNVFGFTKDEYLKSLPDQDKYIKILGRKICFHGHKKNEHIVKELHKSDFSILLRDRKKDTMAGFPTKISESISNGIPVITTDTSDLKIYLKDGEDCFFININDNKRPVENLNFILQTRRKDIEKMKSNCLSKNIFYYANYNQVMREFMLQISSYKNTLLVSKESK